MYIFILWWTLMGEFFALTPDQDGMIDLTYLMSLTRSFWRKLTSHSLASNHLSPWSSMLFANLICEHSAYTGSFSAQELYRKILDGEPMSRYLN